jgi:glycerol uptake facilitator-like aquaporin
LWIRLIIEFLGTFVLVTVAAGSGVINHYVGGGPISRTAAVIAPGAVVMAMIYAWGPLSGLHINPAVTAAFTGRGVFPAKWVVPYWVAQFAGTICAALFLQAMFTHVSEGGNYPISTPGGDWRSLVMEIVLTAILVSVILNTATGPRSIGHNAAIAVGGTVALLGLFASPISGASMNPARTPGPGHRGQRLHRVVDLHRRPGDRRGHRRGHHQRGPGPAEQAGAGGRPGRRPAHAGHLHPDRTTGVSRHHERALLRRSKRAVLREQEDGLPVPAICMADAEMPAMSSSRPTTIRKGGGPRWP